ncbi:extracellular solute-binding protein [Leptolyngbya sp. FACHB-541]|uniref:extracellular solute-binding protein n=1 Tax=Leptolyngbya sp. FACHB-541 TaxID=2692810 RepID=UPI0018F0476D|nr:extracellular solute-binding protein [Leptolyngbya sp. FACHB-541]
MIKRRSLLAGAGALALAQLLAGCNSRSNAALRVRLLDGSVPVQLLRAFQRDLEQQLALDFLPQPQLSDLYDLLQTWKQAEAEPVRSGWRERIPFLNSNRQPENVADLVTLGDYWLASAIRQELIQPLELETLPEWEKLPDRWQALVRRDRQGQLNPEGELWAAPYRWGSAVIAYRIEEFEELGWTPTDWQDLWRPELKGHVSLLDSPTAVIGVTSKKLGQSFNPTDLGEELQAELQALHQQTKFYSSDNYLQPLLLGDTWIALGWSTDVLPVLERDRRIAAIVPESGTILTADVWVRPAAAKPVTRTGDELTLVEQWINFCWQRQNAVNLSLLGTAASPVLTILNRTDLPAPIQQNSVLLPSAAVLERSEFLEPLSEGAIALYRRLWIEVREKVER